MIVQTSEKAYPDGMATHERKEWLPQVANAVAAALRDGASEEETRMWYETGLSWAAHLERIEQNTTCDHRSMQAA